MGTARVDVLVSYEMNPAIEEGEQRVILASFARSLCARAERDGFAPQQINIEHSEPLPNPLLLPLDVESADEYEAKDIAEAWANGAVADILLPGMDFYRITLGSIMTQT